MSYEPPSPPPYEPYAGGGGTEQVPNYLVQSILATLFCCLPFGIVSIVFAAQANTKKGEGDIAGAMEAAGKAKTWAWVSFAAGLVVGVLYILLVVAAGGSDDV